MQASRVTIHMAASLDGFIARKDGRVDWMETRDDFAGGESMDAAEVAAFLKTIDCYVMGSRTYETALGFERKGFGWAYGDTPVFVLTHHARAPLRMAGGTEFRFVTDGIHAALEQARAAAGKAREP